MKNIFKILLIFQLPFWSGYGYVYLNVQKSVMERKIYLAGLRQSELKKRNAALKKEIARLSRDSFSKSRMSGINLQGNSRVIHLDLPRLPEKNK